MSDSDRSALSALARTGIVTFALVVASSSYAENPPQGNTGHHHRQTYNHKAQAAPSPFVVVEVPPDYLQRAAPKSDNRHPEPDKPFWMQWDFWTAIGTIGLAVATIYLVAKTDGLIRSAEKTSARQLRAYVHVEKIGLSGIYSPDTRRIAALDIDVFFKNTGQTPARLVRTDINYGSFANPLAWGFDFPPRHEQGEVGHDVGPGLQAILQISVPADIMENVAVGITLLYCWGWLEYADVIDISTRRRTEFCYQIIPEYAPLMMDGGSFGSSPLQAFNGSDETCLKPPRTSNVVVRDSQPHD